MATTNDLKNGMVLNIEGQLWAVIEFQHVKPGKGPAFVRTKLKNVESNKTVDKTFNAGTKVETATVDRRTMQYLYNDGSSFVFMDVSDYEQIEIAPEIVGNNANFLLENQEAVVATNEGRVLFIELPASVELVVTFTEPGLAGDSATGRTKPATLETGHEIQVPLFINQGEKVKVDTRDSSYMGRVKALMSARSKARKRALDVLFASDVRGESATAALETAIADGEGPTNDYTAVLVRGVEEHRGHIDEVLAQYAEGWTLQRMPAVDRNVLRLGVWELLYAADVPDSVAISEAMALVSDLSTDESPQFVNGVLGAVQRNKAVARLIRRPLDARHDGHERSRLTWSSSAPDPGARPSRPAPPRRA